jgi:hypothetical protein
MAAVVATDEQISSIVCVMRNLRSYHRFSEESCYRFSSAAPRTKREFFEAIEPVPFDGYAVQIEKRIVWNGMAHRGITGEQRLINCFLTLFTAIPLPERFTVLVDIPKSENRRVQHWRKHLSDYFRQQGTSPSVRIKAQIDTSPGGELIQLADMLAGAIRSRAEGNAQEIGANMAKIRLV